MRTRKNIACLTTDELHDLREAVAALYTLPSSSSDSFAVLASFHGGPPTAYCRHGAPGFFTWHRAYLMAFENALRSVRCHVTVPFWDWSSGATTGLPHPVHHATYVNRAGATVANPLYSGPRAAGGNTARRADIDTTPFDDLATTAQAAMSAATFASFQSQMNGVHGGVHGRVGGDMGSVPTASYDPLFFMHHANVDRLWAQWQASHPGPLPATEASFELPPFNRPFTTNWQRGSDVESTTALGYQYRRFCFFFPPIRLWEVVAIDWPWEIRERMTAARLVLKSAEMPESTVEIRAFVDQPDANVGTSVAGNPGLAGTIGLFGGHPKETEHGGGGGADDHGHHGQPDGSVASPERFDIEIDLRAALRAADRKSDKVSLKLVAVDAKGQAVPAEKVPLEDIEIILE